MPKIFSLLQTLSIRSNVFTGEAKDLLWMLFVESNVGDARDKKLL